MAMTLEQFTKRLGQFASQRELDKAMKPPLRKAMRLGKKGIRRALKETTLGAALWKTKDKSGKPSLSLGKTRVERGASGLEAHFTIKGIAASIDQGGKIAPHKIRARGELLAFEGTKGSAGIIRVREVNHPGAIVRRQNTAQPIMDRGIRALEKDVADEFDKLARRLFK